MNALNVAYIKHVHGFEKLLQLLSRPHSQVHNFSPFNQYFTGSSGIIIYAVRKQPLELLWNAL